MSFAEEHIWWAENSKGVNYTRVKTMATVSDPTLSAQETVLAEGYPGIHMTTEREKQYSQNKKCCLINSNDSCNSFPINITFKIFKCNCRDLHYNHFLCKKS